MEYIKVKTTYVDMDGVLADFEGYFKQLFDINSDSIEDRKMWELIENYGKSKFFEELPWMSNGKDLWNFISNNFMRVKILSAIGKSDATDRQTTKGKRSWLAKHIPSLRDQDIIFVENKYKKQYYSKPNDIIIDDRPVVIEEWNKRGGIGILNINARDTIKKLQKYIYDEIE